MTLGTLIVYAGLKLSSISIGPQIDPSPFEQTVRRAGVVVPAEAPLAAAAPAESDTRAGAEVTFYNVNTRETEAFFFRFDGVISQADETRLEHMFRCKRSGHETRADSGLITILARLGAHYPGHVFELVSAHRAVPRSVRDSKHYSGNAVDLRVRGVSLVNVRTFVWENLTDMPIGLGHYHREQFLHIDHRPGEPSIAWDQNRPGQAYRYHPRWSRRGHNS